MHSPFCQLIGWSTRDAVASIELLFLDNRNGLSYILLDPEVLGNRNVFPCLVQASSLWLTNTGCEINLCATHATRMHGWVFVLGRGPLFLNFPRNRVRDIYVPTWRSGECLSGSCPRVTQPLRQLDTLRQRSSLQYACSDMTPMLRFFAHAKASSDSFANEPQPLLMSIQALVKRKQVQVFLRVDLIRGAGQSHVEERSQDVIRDSNNSSGFISSFVMTLVPNS